MNQTRNVEARYALKRAQTEFKLGQRGQAYRWAAKAAQLAPHLVEPWLLLASVASPVASVAYIKRALEINPHSKRAAEGLVWAEQREREWLKQQRQQAATRGDGGNTSPVRLASVLDHDLQSESIHPKWIQIWIVFLCMIFMVITVFPLSELFFTAFTPKPATGLVALNQPSPSPFVPPTQKPSATQLPSPTTTNTPVPEYTKTSTPVIMETPEVISTKASIPVVEITIISPLNIAQPVVSTNPVQSYPQAQPLPVGSSGGKRWIDVNLSQQTVYAFEGDQVVGTFVVSTGTSNHPTVTGQYKVYIKLLSDDMAGPGYYLPNVPYVMYFYKGYSFHGTYWHSNFGNPMSHGCVNMRTADAKWLFNWASVGTLVNVHY